MKQSVLKLPKGVSQEFIDGIQSMTSDQLKAQIVILQIQNQENEGFMDDPKVQEEEQIFHIAKERHNEVVGPVKETRISIKNKTKLLVERLKEKGAA